MPRSMRFEFAGGCYHVLNRGNYSLEPFKRSKAAELFETVLDEAATKFRWQVHAYVILPDLFHLVVELTEPNLADGMKWLQGTWARRHNLYIKRIGRPFEGTYRSILVEPGYFLGQVCHHIHLNPVRAGRMALGKVQEYRWSSLAQFPRKGRPHWLYPGTVLAEAGGLRDTRAGWRKYCGYLERLATDKELLRDLVATVTTRNLCLGSDEFQHEIRERMRKQGVFRDRSELKILEKHGSEQEREELWEEHLQKVARLAGINLDELPIKKSADDKCRLAAVMKLSSSASNAWLTGRLDMGQPASVSKFVRRWMDDKLHARHIHRLCKMLREGEK